MVGWESQEETVGMAVSTAVIVVAGIGIAWIGYDAAGAPAPTEAVIGVALGGLAISVQTWVARRDAAGEPLVENRGIRLAGTLLLAIVLIQGLEAVPGLGVGFGSALAVLGVLSRVYLYRRAATAAPA